MKTTKIIASVLAASLLMSVATGCALFDNDDKNVIAAAKKYGDAVVSGDAGDILELVSDGDKFEDDFTEYLEGDDKYEDVYDAILSSMSYEIDEKSVTSSKKNAEASIEFTFTLVDYETIYENVSDDKGSFDDYVEALEDNDDDDTIEITQTVNFVLDGKEWLVKDKKLKGLYEVFEYVDAVTEYTWGGDFEAITVEFFEQVLMDTLGYDCKEYFEDLYWTAQYAGNDMKIDIFQQYDLSHAAEVFEKSYTGRFEEILSLDAFDGNYAYEFTGTGGYVILDGYIDYDNGWFNHDGYIYGGLFFAGDVFVIALAYTSDSSRQAEIDRFLTALGYPVPGDFF